MADHLEVVTGATRGVGAAILPATPLLVDARGHGHPGAARAGRPAHFQRAWSLHLADSRDRVGQAAALGPEGGRRAPLARRRSGPTLRPAHLRRAP
jgi:hypothetical protein